jgi:hypothetical protein
MKRHTAVTIQGEKFFINGKPTYAGRKWKGCLVEGLLMNTRMVQATFDDLNPQTRHNWVYADTSAWDAERNLSEFQASMPTYRDHGVLAFTTNLQGGSPYGYSKMDEQIWHNSGVTPEGDLRPEYMSRMERVIERADELGMVVIMGIYYFGQERHLKDEAAIKRGVENAVDWVLEKGFTNVLIEVNNECNIIYR